MLDGVVVLSERGEEGVVDFLVDESVDELVGHGGEVGEDPNGLELCLWESTYSE